MHRHELKRLFRDEPKLMSRSQKDQKFWRRKPVQRKKSLRDHR